VIGSGSRWSSRLSGSAAPLSSPAMSCHTSVSSTHDPSSSGQDDQPLPECGAGGEATQARNDASRSLRRSHEATAVKLRQDGSTDIGYQEAVGDQRF
jgi:hypothetical protein